MRRRVTAVLISTTVLLGGGLAAGLTSPAQATLTVKCAAEAAVVVKAQVAVTVAIGETARARAQAELQAALVAHAACVAHG